MEKQLHFLSLQLIAANSTSCNATCSQESPTTCIYGKVFAALRSFEMLMAAYPLNNKSVNQLMK